jgi:hypothetical protein
LEVGGGNGVVCVVRDDAIDDSHGQVIGGGEVLKAW